MSKLLMLGTIAIDDTQTQSASAKAVLGGSGSYASIAAAKFTETVLISVIGRDFSKKYLKHLIKAKVNLKNVRKLKNQKTFAYKCKYAKDLSSRITLQTDLNCLKDFEIGKKIKFEDYKYLCLCAFSPKTQLQVIEKTKSTKLIMADTIEYYILNNKEEFIQVLKKTDGIVINEQEAKLFTGKQKTGLCAKEIAKYGPKIIIIKMAEKGAVLFYNNRTYSFKAKKVSRIIDPTGAGDSFIGAIAGRLASNEFNFKKANALNLLIDAIEFGIVTASQTIMSFSIGSLAKIKTEDLKYYKQLYILKTKNKIKEDENQIWKKNQTSNTT